VAAFNKADRDHARCLKFVREVAALDRRDFLVVAPGHLPKGERLTLLPSE
jgi:hypothetical protein